ncbi:MAG: 2-amino-4-hydroxy-6-hydroxymethyldihydropteridine diphosphokinase, partial [Comamonas sp.]|nr:2-amino-4-hydroxy-6-hydroxymethyldihydropteridine diphosphokinase [Comamonas sp.]
MPTTTVYVGLGANLGDRGQALQAAVHAMAALPGTQLQAVSSLYSSAPIEATGPDYLNAVAVLTTDFGPEAFLQQLQHLE